MGRQSKIPQRTEFNRRPNCFGRFQKHGQKLAGWRRPDCPLMVEAGAGRARTSLAFAAANPGWQVLAVDQKSDRLNQAAREEPPPNLAFLQADIDRAGDYLDLTGQIGLLWLAFPDPQAKQRRLKHRLASPARLELFRGWLAAGGVLRLKTDHAGFFADSRQLLEADPSWQLTAATADLSEAGDYPADVLVQTAYEAKFRAQGRPICYLEARIGQNRPNESKTGQP